jgi:hypothetical protein
LEIIRAFVREKGEAKRVEIGDILGFNAETSRWPVGLVRRLVRRSSESED